MTTSDISLETWSNDGTHQFIKAPQISKSSSHATSVGSVVAGTIKGGLVGGVTGMVVAGPVGAIAGSYAAMMMGVAKFTVDRMEERKNSIECNERDRCRELSMRKYQHFPSNSKVDAEWKDIAKQARENSEKSVLLHSCSSNPHKNDIQGSSEPRSLCASPPLSSKDRAKRDLDIIATDEEELSTSEKISVLIARSLNDKCSTCGRVYRALLEAYHVRDGGRLQNKIDNDVKLHLSTHLPVMDGKKLKATDISDISGASLTERRRDEQEKKAPLMYNHDTTRDTIFLKQLPNARRQDAHALIFQATAALIEARPGLEKYMNVVTPVVQTFAFCELYNLVFDEIVMELNSIEVALIGKICDYTEKKCCTKEIKPSSTNEEIISQQALSIIRLLPEMHAPADKLSCCVQFVDIISNIFSTEKNVECSKNVSNFDEIIPSLIPTIDAELLLQLVCRHIICAKVPSINGELTFVEEFTKDQIQGRESYALVTMQASLQLLNNSTNFDNDIFFA